MPITLQPLSRRRFLAGATAGAAALALNHWTLGEASPVVDANRVALLSDIHISANLAEHNRSVVMANHLRDALKAVLGAGALPSRLFINGDCAYLHGLAGDYSAVIDLIRPVREAGVPMHLALGNHDSREQFWNALPADEARSKELADHEVLDLSTPAARWIVLDSLKETSKTPGLLGEQQLNWLSKSLDAEPAKPTIVMVHHNPVFKAPTTQPTTQPAHGLILTTGLLDSPALLDVLLRRRQVKALFFGHTHAWKVSMVEGLHCVNLPAVAYVFSPEQPSGWVDARFSASGMRLTLNTLDPAHQWNGQSHDLAWR